ncbi:MAG: circadian clock protein KaiC [Phenylobacterium sp.]|uniref:circadian clock protein KaiC n=1 Tax=Phenylobacterium sp. TaxID=1871053 RepID=UPI0027219A33|nr:circadian clock protein KaiC [Phenylobacterium sp.]MDO8911831.1 circadian clock protein KaiC [Phenylobacterium sp.]MDP3102245.1 circadian clock protein KaiC [Phenylobacterium sp.]
MTIHTKAMAAQLLKAPSGVAGLDEITFGGLPAGRPTLIAGAAGCGKTLFALTFLVKGATEHGEPGVLMSFEERAQDLVENVSSLGYDLPGLIAENRLIIDYVRVERSEIEQSGEYDLEALFIRLGHAIDKIGAKRVVLDTLEALFSGLGDGPVLRAELRRLFQWLKDRGVTAMITAERGAEGQLTRHGLEEYVSDCVIALDNRVEEQITTRRLRVMKYRGSAHGTNEYPFLIDQGGISVLPVTSAGLSHSISDEVVSSGIGGIDAMLGIGGFYRGSSVLLSGPSGTGKTTFGSQFVNAACVAGQKAIYFSFEESPEQIVRNMQSVGLDLGAHVASGLLRFESARPSLFGLEMHLVLMIRQIEAFNPAVVVVDPISAFRGSESEIHATLLRLVDYLKVKGITGVFNNLISADHHDRNDQSLSSLMDVWIGLHDLQANGERNRGLFVLKARGMSHSNQIREYLLGSGGVTLIEPYIGPHGVMTGSARIVQEAQEEAAALERLDEVNRRHREFVQKRNAAERQIAETREALEREEAELLALETVDERKEEALTASRFAAATRRGSSL